MSAQSDSPKTDARIDRHRAVREEGWKQKNPDDWVHADFARSLELSNAEMVAALQILVAGSTTPTNGVTRAPSWEAVERANAVLSRARGRRAVRVISRGSLHPGGLV